MKFIFARTLTVVAFALISAFAAQAQCGTEEAGAVYKKFLDNYKGAAEQQKAAAEVGREYLAKYGSCPEEADKKIAAFVGKWLEKYAAAVIEFECVSAVERAPAQAFRACGPYLAKDSENLKAWLLLSLAGIRSASDPKMQPEMLKATRKAKSLIDSGKTVDNWVLGKDKPEAVAALEFYSAYYTVDAAPADSVAAMLQIARSGTSYAQNPSTYVALGRGLTFAELNPVYAEYKNKCVEKPPDPADIINGPDAKKPEPPARDAKGRKILTVFVPAPAWVPPAECEGIVAKHSALSNRVIDAYARAIALSKDKPENAKLVEGVRPVLVDMFKRQNAGSDAGLDKFVADVLAKPLP